MNEQTKISFLGLPKQDMTVLTSIIKLWSTVSPLNYLVLEPSRSDEANLLFINGDDPETVTEWENIKNNKNFASSILVSDRDHGDGVVTLRRPLIMKRVQEALKKVTGIKQSLEHTPNYREMLSQSKRILVVDDSFPVRKYMEHKLPELSDDPLTLEFAASGKEAIEKAKMKAYDRIFLDVMMPDIDGYKVCKWIKTARPKTKILMLTSKKSPFDKVRGAMSGCDAYVTKPPEDKKLKSALEK